MPVCERVCEYVCAHRLDAVHVDLYDVIRSVATAEGNAVASLAALLQRTAAEAEAEAAAMAREVEAEGAAVAKSVEGGAAAAVHTIEQDVTKIWDLISSPVRCRGGPVAS